MSLTTPNERRSMPFALLSWEQPPSALTPPFRRPRPGPETDLVDWFLRRWPLKTSRGCGVTVFREPHLQSGIPDLVIVIWDIETAKRWNPYRATFTKSDFQLMQLVLSTGTLSNDMLTRVGSKNTLKQLLRLEEARLLYTKSNVWKAASLTRVFA